MNDITSLTDIQLLVNRFYDKVRQDSVLGPIFHSIIGDDWSHHLPIMYDFWGTVLLNEGSYRGNTIEKHIQVDKQFPLQEAFYQQWLVLWEETIDGLFTGEKAEEAKKRAGLMMGLIKFKVEAARTGRSIV